MPSRRKLWADSLPKSPSTGVAMVENRRFNTDGSIQSRRENEDGYFNCIFNSTSLLMVLDGHDGKRAQEYVKEEMPELIVRMVEDTGSNDEIRSNFVDIFRNVDKGFFRKIDDLLTERAVLKIELDECPNSSVALERYPNHVTRLSELDEQIKGGTTVAVAVIKHDKLYVANVGDTRVLLCLVHPQNNYLLVDQLTVDHNTSCEEELKRLKLIGLDPDQLRRAGRLGTQQNTRCIGDFNIKNGYADIDILRNATKPPGIAVPHVAGPVIVNQARGFIIVMSDGLYDAWSAYTDQDTSKANIEIARMVAERMKGKQQSLEDVARTVVDSVVSSVQSTYASSQKSECRRLDDVTLMIHNLGYDALECPLNGIVNYPLTTTPIPSVPPPLNAYYSQPGGVHQGQVYGNIHHQGGGQYNQPIQHMSQSYIDPRYIASAQFPPRGQPPTNYYTPTPIYQHPPATRPENPFVFPSQPQQPVPQVQGPPQVSGPPRYPLPNTQEYPSTNYNTSNQSLLGVTNHRSTSDLSPSGYGPANQSSSFNSSYGSNVPADASNSSYSNQGLNYSGNVSNTSLVRPQQVAGRVSTSPVPPQVNYATAQAQPHPQIVQPHLQKAPVSHSGSTSQFPSTSDEDGESTPIADPSGKDVFPTDQSGKKPVPRPRRTKALASDDSQTSLTQPAEQSFSTTDQPEIPQPQSSSTPKKGSDSQPHTRDSLDASNLKDEDLYGSDEEKGEDTFEAPLPGAGEKVELTKLPVENQPPPLEPETAKSSEGNQLDQYIFDSDGEMEKYGVSDDHSTNDEVDDDDDEEVGTVDMSKLSLMAQSAEPAQNIVYSYIKFDNFPDIEYDAL